MEPIVVVMAAGMGSRYGGLKQIDPVGQHQEIIADYSVFDAVRAGFKRFVFIIKEENRKLFEEALTDHLPKDLDLDFAYQRTDDLPEGFRCPEGRIKPWGTGHAIHAARAKIDAPFMVINADDYYGREAFQIMYDFLKEPGRPAGDYAMVAYRLANTLTKNGSVSRGVCRIEEGKLVDVTERTEIYPEEKGGKYTEDGGKTFVSLPEETYVSMNFWGFQPDLLASLETGFSSFLERAIQENPLKAEYYLPSVVTERLKDNSASVTVLTTDERWMGVTYQEDRDRVKEGFKKLAEEGVYPSPLW